jgi:hypothetical protein
MVRRLSLLPPNLDPVKPQCAQLGVRRHIEDLLNLGRVKTTFIEKADVLPLFRILGRVATGRSISWSFLSTVGSAARTENRLEWSAPSAGPRGKATESVDTQQTSSRGPSSAAIPSVRRFLSNQLHQGSGVWHEAQV